MIASMIDRLGVDAVLCHLMNFIQALENTSRSQLSDLVTTQQIREKAREVSDIIKKTD